MGVDDLIKEMRLGDIGGRAVSVSSIIMSFGVVAEIVGQCYSTSNKTKHVSRLSPAILPPYPGADPIAKNLDIVLAWLTQRAH